MPAERRAGRFGLICSILGVMAVAVVVAAAVLATLFALILPHRPGVGSARSS